MKKILVIFLVTVMMFSLVACGEKNSSIDTQEEESQVTVIPSIATERDYDENNPTAVLDEITNDFANVTSQLAEKLTETFATVGTTYDDYQKNKGLVDMESAAIILEQYLGRKL